MQALLNKRQVAEVLGVHPNTVDRMRRESGFPAPIRFPGSSAVRWRPEDLESWLAASTENVTPIAGPRRGRRKSAAEHLS